LRDVVELSSLDRQYAPRAPSRGGPVCYTTAHQTLNESNAVLQYVASADKPKSVVVA